MSRKTEHLYGGDDLVVAELVNLMRDARREQIAEAVACIGWLPAPADLLSVEDGRQRLSEEVPGFMPTLAAAMGVDAPVLLGMLARGEITKTGALAALAQHAISLTVPKSRHTQLGQLPVDVNTVDRLDKALGEMTVACRELAREKSDLVMALAAEQARAPRVAPGEIEALADALRGMAYRLAED